MQARISAANSVNCDLRQFPEVGRLVDVVEEHGHYSGDAAAATLRHATADQALQALGAPGGRESEDGPPGALPSSSRRFPRAPLYVRRASVRHPGGTK